MLRVLTHCNLIRVLTHCIMIRVFTYNKGKLGLHPPLVNTQIPSTVFMKPHKQLY